MNGISNIKEGFVEGEVSVVNEGFESGVTGEFLNVVVSGY